MILTGKQVADRLGVDPSLVRRWCRMGKLTGMRTDATWLIEDAVVAEFEATRAGRGRPRGLREEAKR